MSLFSIQTSQIPIQHTIEALKPELEKLHQLSKHGPISDIEIETIIERVVTLGKSIILEYSKNQSLIIDDGLIEDIKAKVREASALLQKKSITGKVKITFNSTLTQTKDNPKADGTHKPIKEGQAVKRASINEKEFVRSLSKSLTDLETVIVDFQTHGIVIEHFKKNSTFPEKLAIFRDKFITGLFSKILNKLSSQIFIGHKPQVSLVRARKEMAELEKTEKQIEEKVVELTQKKAKAERALQNAESSKSKKSINSLIAQKTKHEEEIGKLADTQTEIQTKKATNQKKIDKYEGEQERGRKTRANFHTIGGTNVKIQLEDATLDGMHISCDAFRASLKDAGAQTFKLNFKPSSADSVLSLKGLCFPKQAMGGVVDKALNSLGAFTSLDKEGAGWQKLQLEDGRTLIITDEEAEKLQDMDLMDKDGKLLENPNWDNELDVKEWDISKPGTEGTVLLTSGNVGVYEMHKREMLSFLMRGVNVMAINFRGYGESQGIPTGEGLKRDMEAAYQYLKKQHNVPDEKIILKALCMSGGAATDLAAHHPDVNLFIDQSYANFDELVMDQAQEYIHDFIKENNLDHSAMKSLKGWVNNQINSIVHAAIKLATPAWSVEREIGKVKGHVGILLTTQDSLMNVDRDVAKNYKAALKGKKAKSITVFSMEGEHSDSWIYPLKAAQVNAKVIKTSQPEVIEKALAALPKEAIEIGNKYRITYYPDKVKNTINEIVADQYDDKKEAFKFFNKQFQLSLGKIKQKIKNGEALTEAVLNEIADEQLKDVDPAIKKDFKDILSENINVRDELFPYKYVLSDSDKLDDKLDELLQQFPEILAPGEDSQKVVEDLKNKLQKVVKKLHQGQGLNLEEIIEQEVKNSSEKHKTIVRSFLEEGIVERNPLELLYEKIVYLVNSDKDVTPKQINDYINQKIAGLPNQFQGTFRTFMNEHINIQDDALDPDKFRARRYEGRANIDRYLQKTELVGDLI